MELSAIIFIPIIAALAVGIGWALSRRYLISVPDDRQRFHRSTLVQVLLDLDERFITELLHLYKEQFGPGPARYARRTFRRWKTGEVRPATQTFQRFLHHLPHVMSFDLKCEILRRFMEEYAPKDKYSLEVTTGNWEPKLEPLVHQVIQKAYSAELPAEVERKLRWLGEGDMRAAREILRRSQAAEGRIIVSMLREEFANIEKLLHAEHLKPKVVHTLKFPYGSIELTIKRS